jgi:hypothetical protein
VEEALTNRRISFSLRRFSLLQLLVLVAIVALVLAGWLQNHYTELDHSLSQGASTPDGRTWAISSGTKNDRLVYAVFAGGKGEVPSHVTVKLSGRYNHSAVLTKPDGMEIRLDGKKQLFEIVDGKYRDSDERVTLNQFNAFMKSNPEEYTIEQLLEFAKSHK